MHIASLVASTALILLLSGCAPVTSSLQESEKAVPDDSICPTGMKLKHVGGESYVCEP